MYGDPDETHNQDPRARRWPRRTAASAAMVIASAMVVAACGGGSTGPAVAGVGSSTKTTSSSTGSTKGSALAYSRCMQGHGIKDFPDPNSNGGLSISAHPGSDLDPNNPLYQAADKACKSLAPQAPTSGPEQARAASAMLRYARCMRAHGIKDFPDPSANGMVSVKATPGSDLDPNNPHQQAADKACHSNLPGGAGTPQTNSTGGSGSQ